MKIGKRVINSAFAVISIISCFLSISSNRRLYSENFVCKNNNIAGNVQSSSSVIQKVSLKPILLPSIFAFSVASFLCSIYFLKKKTSNKNSSSDSFINKETGDEEIKDNGEKSKKEKIDEDNNTYIVLLTFGTIAVVIINLCLCCKKNINGVGGVETKDTPKIYLKYKKSESNVCIRMCNIVELECECIVNAAKPDLSGGGGVDGAIHDAAGKKLLKKACKDELEKLKLGQLATGKAVSTDSFELKNKYKKTINYIIHTVGPNLNGREGKGATQKDEQDLKNCYANSLDLAKVKNIHSIAFPAISTFNYKFPTDLAAKLSFVAVKEWLEKNNKYKIEIVFSCFDESTYIAYKNAISNESFFNSLNFEKQESKSENNNNVHLSAGNASLNNN